MSAAPASPPPRGRLRLFDAHNHLHDARFGGSRSDLLAAARAAGVRRMVVNGTCEQDWPAVAALAREAPDLVIPAFGLHPWRVPQRSPAWRERLIAFLESTPGATVGEIGLDRWILDAPPGARRALDASLGGLEAAPLAEQKEVFLEQLQLAADRELPASIHCLQAWGALDECLRQARLPGRGFLLHSYGGPAEMVAPFASLGARFSFPGYFLHARKRRQRETFRCVPSDRLLAETDAPDQRLPDPDEWPEDLPAEIAGQVIPLADASGRPLNHPGNLPAVVAGLASVLGQDEARLADSLAANFARLFVGERDNA